MDKRHKYFLLSMIQVINSVRQRITDRPFQTNTASSSIVCDCTLTLNQHSTLIVTIWRSNQHSNIVSCPASSKVNHPDRSSKCWSTEINSDISLSRLTEARSRTPAAWVSRWRTTCSWASWIGSPGYRAQGCTGEGFAIRTGWTCQKNLRISQWNIHKPAWALILKLL